MKKIVGVVVLILFIGLVNADSIFLSDYMEEGQTRVYETDGGVYIVSLLSVSEAKEKAVFRLNDEMSKGIKLKDSYVFKDGSEIVLKELVISDAKEGNDEAYYYFYGTGKGILPLSNVSMYAVEELCNFDGQCLNETKDNCCYDCGCNEEEECINNRCVSLEEEKKEEVKEEVEEKKEMTKKQKIKDFPTSESKDLEEKEKKAAYVMLIIILIFILVVTWFVAKKKRRSF